MPRVVPSQVVELIDQLFNPQSSEGPDPNNRLRVDLDRSGKLAALADLAKQVPPELITLSAADYGALICGLAQIREAVRKVRLRHVQDETHSELYLSPIGGLGNENPIMLVRRLLAKCPDEYPSRKTAELLIIDDESYRDLLRRDVHAVDSALQNGEWKAATVLAGSVIEALLLWAIARPNQALRNEAIDSVLNKKRLTRRPDSDPEKWGLHELIEVGLELGLIEENTAKEARLAKDYRNLIHPGRAVRQGQQCDRGTALLAVAGLVHVVADLERSSN